MSLTLIRIIISYVDDKIQNHIRSGQKHTPLHVSTSIPHRYYHVFVVLVLKVKHRQDRLELAEDLIVSRHVSGQDASVLNE